MGSHIIQWGFKWWHIQGWILRGAFIIQWGSISNYTMGFLLEAYSAWGIRGLILCNGVPTSGVYRGGGIRGLILYNGVPSRDICSVGRGGIGGSYYTFVQLGSN